MIIQSTLRHLAEKHFSKNILTIAILPQSGSSRQYFRITFTEMAPIIGVYNADLKENEAFFSFTYAFLSQKIPVPQIYAISEDRLFYLLQDLGDETLFSLLTRLRKNQPWPGELTAYYKKVIDQLPRLQFSGKKGIDFDKCYPRKAFDRQSIQWDLNYFKYFFLKLAGIPFDEQLLEDDFNTFIQFLLSADNDYFLFRDFQSRNIMILKNEVYFIDYQGGRKGALQYDIASLLFDGKADIPQSVRDELLDYYVQLLEKNYGIEGENFHKYYYGFVLVRIMQALGAYGFRGYFEKKSHFLLSIPYAINNIRYILENHPLPIEIPSLMNVLHKIAESDLVKKMALPNEQLTVSVSSFSYKKGIPEDYSGNGGGFIFDCRSLPNPGRYPEYQSFTGKDESVIRFLEKYSEIEEFKELTDKLVCNAIDNYLLRKFTHIMVCFGCTGGQHRSVYFAESLAKTLKARYPNINVVLNHREQK